MIDIHTHILPGLDDGARDMDDSLEMAVIAAQSGVHALAATSHANTGGFFSEYSVEEYMKRLSDFRRELDREAIPLTVLSGMEIFMTHEVPDMIREERLLPLNETDYFLMEFSFGIEQEEMDELIDGVMELGVTDHCTSRTLSMCTRIGKGNLLLDGTRVSYTDKQRKYLWKIRRKSKDMCRSFIVKKDGYLYCK